MNLKLQFLWQSLIFLPLFLTGCIYVDERQLKDKGLLPVVWERSGQPMEETNVMATGIENELFRAIEIGDISLALDLLGDGANPRAVNEDEVGIYELAIKFNATPVVDWLIGSKVPVIGGDAFNTALLFNKNYYLERMLAISNVDQHCRDGSTPLIAAVNLGDPDYVELLLEYGANPNFTSLDFSLPLEVAAKKANKMRLPDVDYNYEKIEELLRSY